MKTRFKTQVSSGSDFASDSMDELKPSRSENVKNFPNFEMLDAKIASALNKIIQNSQFKKEC